jgi:ribosomal protein L34E
MIHDPYRVERRKPLTQKQKLKMFIANDGICCVCGRKINGVKEAWDEHDDPLWLNGTNADNNRKPAHAKCARSKSADEAVARGKVQRVAERHFGAKKTKQPFPGSRASPWKRRMDGTVVKR